MARSPLAPPEGEIRSTAKQQERALEVLAELGGLTMARSEIQWHQGPLTLPQGMTLRDAAQFLMAKQAEQDQPFSFHRQYKYLPMDGAHALRIALLSAFGMTLGKGRMTMFGYQPPEQIEVEIGVGETIQVPYGDMEVPGMDGVTLTAASWHDDETGLELFMLQAYGPKRHEAALHGLFALVEQVLQTQSIYRGKAIDGRFHFLATDIDPESVVYSDEVLQQLSANVWAPIRHTQAHLDAGLPLKRAVLLEGPYGTGKSLAAALTAQEAVANEWTFIKGRPGQDDLNQVMAVARLYEPAVVFFEDLDTAAAKQTKLSISKLLDTFDGIDAKRTRIEMVLTTNSVEELHAAMLRPGRLDAVIHIENLDRPGVEKLTRYLIKERLADDVNFDKVFLAMSDYPPAFIREAIDRTKRYSLARSGAVETVTTEDLVQAADGLRAQLELMNKANFQPAEDTVEDIIAKRTEDALRRTQLPNGAHLKVIAPKVGVIQPN